MNVMESFNKAKEKLLVEKEKNITLEASFVLKEVKDTEINLLMAEIISLLYNLKDKYREYRPATLKDIEEMDRVVKDMYLHEIKTNYPDLYDEINKNIHDRLEKLLTKKADYLTKDEIYKYNVKICDECITQEICKFLNMQIKDVNDIMRSLNKIINDDLKTMKMIQKLLNNRIIDIDKIVELVNNSYLENEIKDIVIKEARSYFEKKEKEKIELEEKNKLDELENFKKIDLVEEDTELKDESSVKLFNINNYDYIIDVINKYEELFPSELIGLEIEKQFSLEDLKQVLNFSFGDVDDEIFSSSFITLLAFIDGEKDENKISDYVSYLNELCSKYEIYNNLYDVTKQLNDICILPNLSEEDLKIITTFRARVENIRNSNNDNMIMPIIENMKLTLYSIKNENRKKDRSNGDIEIKAFVLFDYYEEDGLKKAYVLDDLNPLSDKNYIDPSVEKEKIVSGGYLDFNDLIEDIITLGNVEICLNSNDKMSKLVRPVYFNFDNHKMIDTKMSNSSGIYRIRPRLSSHLRFFDEKELFIPGTKKFEQIKELMCKSLPNIIIADNKPLSIFINYQNAIKKKDMDSYSDSLKRQANSKIREVLKNGKDYFDDNELVILSDAIDLSLDSYEELKKINDAFDFGIVHKISRNRHLG